MDFKSPIIDIIDVRYGISTTPSAAMAASISPAKVTNAASRSTPNATIVASMAAVDVPISAIIRSMWLSTEDSRSLIDVRIPSPLLVMDSIILLSESSEIVLRSAVADSQKEIGRQSKNPNFQL